MVGNTEQKEVEQFLHSLELYVCFILKKKIELVKKKRKKKKRIIPCLREKN